MTISVSLLAVSQYTDLSVDSQLSSSIEIYYTAGKLIILYT